MTAEREAMTERQAFEKWARCIHLNVRKMKDGVYSYADTILARAGWKAAIDHLSRAAEPAGQVCGVLLERPRRKAYGIEFFGESLPYGTKLYTHPPEPARDSDVERVARAIYAHVFSISIPRMGVRTATFDEVWAVPVERERMQAQARAAIAAMAQESGDAKEGQ